MDLNSLDDLLLHELKDLHSAEKQLTKALPKMAKAASSPKLRQAFERHLGETEQQLERLERIFERLEAKPGRHKCKAMEGLIEEGSELIKEDGEPAVKDAALIAAAQRVEHYEIAGYGAARTYAEMLGHSEAARLLQTTLDEEKATDAKLNDLALSEINVNAEEESEEESEDESEDESEEGSEE